MNQIEIFNEMTILICFYFSVVFFEPDFEVKSKYGIFVIILISSNIAINIATNYSQLFSKKNRRKIQRFFRIKTSK
jgi:hypothetical protein